MPSPETSNAQRERSVSVPIADDQALVRAGFRAILEAQPGISVAGEAIDGRNAVDLARRRHPDVVLVDIQMPDLNGIEAARRILAEADNEHPVAVLTLTTFDFTSTFTRHSARARAAFSSRTYRPRTSSPPFEWWLG